MEKIERELTTLSGSEDTLKANLAELLELKTVLQGAEEFLDEVSSENDEHIVTASHIFCKQDQSNVYAVSLEEAILETRKLGYSKLKIHFKWGTNNKLRLFRYIVGLIKSEKFPSFERLIWRACRGNILLRSKDAEHLESEVMHEQCVQ